PSSSRSSATVQHHRRGYPWIAGNRSCLGTATGLAHDSNFGRVDFAIKLSARNTVPLNRPFDTVQQLRRLRLSDASFGSGDKRVTRGTDCHNDVAMRRNIRKEVSELSGTVPASSIRECHDGQ